MKEKITRLNSQLCDLQNIYESTSSISEKKRTMEKMLDIIYEARSSTENKSIQDKIDDFIFNLLDKFYTEAENRMAEFESKDFYELLEKDTEAEQIAFKRDIEDNAELINKFLVFCKDKYFGEYFRAGITYRLYKDFQLTYNPTYHIQFTFEAKRKMSYHPWKSRFYSIQEIKDAEHDFKLLEVRCIPIDIKTEITLDTEESNPAFRVNEWRV